ncbi:unnamed protein product, partial [Polarella glacialis]
MNKKPTSPGPPPWSLGAGRFWGDEGDAEKALRTGLGAGQPAAAPGPDRTILRVLVGRISLGARRLASLRLQSRAKKDQAETLRLFQLFVWIPSQRSAS